MMVTEQVHMRHLALLSLDDDYSPPFSVEPDGDGGYLEEHQHECARWTVYRDADLEPVSLEVDYIDTHHPGWMGDDWTACLVDYAGGVGIAVTRLSDDASITIIPGDTGELLDAIADLEGGADPMAWEDGLGRSLPQAMHEDRVPDRYRMHEMMLALHATGWRPHERAYIQREYDLNDSEVEMLCEMMQDAIDGGDLPMYDTNYRPEDDDDDA